MTVSLRLLLVALGLTVLVGCSTAAPTISAPEQQAPEQQAPGRSSIVAATLPVGPPLRVSYGPGADNVGDLYLPANGQDSLPVIVMIHGGGWQQRNTMTYMGPLSAALAQQGVAVWSIEYRRGDNRWADTLADVAAATDAVGGVVQEASGNRLNTNSIHVTGHSAGGQLAAWVAARGALPVDAVGAQPAVSVESATIMAGVLDMRLAAAHGGDKLVPAWLGGMPDRVPGRYQLASPIEHLPTGVPVTALHGDADTVVSVEQARTYVSAATAAGDPARLVELPGVGHGGFVDPSSPAWQRTIDTIVAYVTT